MLQNDRQITISTAGSRKATHWLPSTLMWSELVERLHTPVRGTESLADYLALKKGAQDDLKDVGGYVAGTLRGNRRKLVAVAGRDVLTLDLDNIPAGGTQDVLRRVDSLGCSYCVYSTRKHHEAAPRLRILLPLDRVITADEYEPIARKAAELIAKDDKGNLLFCDPSTFEPHRLMYWPSCCADSQYVYTYGDKPFLYADGVLALYTDWHNVTSWPQVAGAQPVQIPRGKQSDPEAKNGVVGAFCRIYDVYRAMEELIPGEYIPCDTDGRYTYAGGSTTGGAVIYDHGKFIYSHHATDPCGGKLVNAFDLVRLHRFGALDDDAKSGTPPNKLPSYLAMCEYAVADTHVAALLNTERYEKATQEFETPSDMADTNWIIKLQVSPSTGTPAKTSANAALLLDNDPRIKGRIKKDLFADRLLGIAPLPWGSRETDEGLFNWADEDDSGLRMYIEKVLGFRSKEIVDDALKNHYAKYSFNPVVDYLGALQWDGVKRLDTILIDYLGASDTPYVRAVSRKAFTAAVARAMEPGVKYDTMTILTGPQGIGKSTLLKKMGRKWFSDSIKTFEGKEASELVQGVWIVELGELEAFNKSEIGRIKQFLSQQEDIYRAAYGRHVGWHPRRCVFFGTSNNGEYLRDKTGNRRFWPIDVGVTEHSKSVFRDLEDEIDQLWAEAVVYWRLGEPLYLTGDIEAQALAEQEAHRETSAREGLIIEFINREVPEDWQRWDLQRRLMFWQGGMQGNIRTVPRTRVCALEVWCELFGGDFKGIKYTDAAEINAVIGSILGWVRLKNGAQFGYCKLQRGFEKVLH
ncbi:MAG: VapE domain-containing protein [Acetanaerobacterium sp.]